MISNDRRPFMMAFQSKVTDLSLANTFLFFKTKNILYKPGGTPEEKSLAGREPWRR